MDPDSSVGEQRYDPDAFGVPEGVEFDVDGFEAVEPVLRELSLSQNQAGKLVSAYSEKIVPLMQKRSRASIDKDAAELRANMARELEADPEVGGKNLNQARAFAAKAIAHLIPDKAERERFATLMNATGFGNQRHLVRIFAGAGRLLSDGRKGGGKPATDAEKFYGRK